MLICVSFGLLSILYYTDMSIMRVRATLFHVKIGRNKVLKNGGDIRSLDSRYRSEPPRSQSIVGGTWEIYSPSQ